MAQCRSMYDDESYFYPSNNGIVYKAFATVDSDLFKEKSKESDFDTGRRMNRRAQYFVSEYNPAPCRWKLCANFY
uniref:Kringle domain-containing protein n=1 Tax=Parastrongyloides trichosuri TaxID=131310 RepID=A0A0N4ZAX3_PARTI